MTHEVLWNTPQNTKLISFFFPCSTILPTMLPGHSPSWMRTLMRRTSPHLALVRNSLSSGVTTSARNIASQSLPLAKRCSGGRGTDGREGMDRTGDLQHQTNIQSRRTKGQPVNKCPLRPMMWLRTGLTTGELCRACPVSLRVCGGVTGGHHSSN